MSTRRINVLAILFFTCFLSIITYSQDIIIKTNGEEIDAKVVEVTPELVKYYKFNKTEGPLYSIYISDVYMIKYPDGSKDIFNNKKDNQEVSDGESNGKEEIEIDKFVDERDGRKYKTVKIGDQWWMAENLQYKTGGSTCYDNDSSKCEKCGQYYNFDVAISACPEGWHLPSDDEWIKLEIAVGMSSVEAKKSGWRGTSGGQASELISGGASGLDLELCGGRMSNVSNVNIFLGLNRFGYYWTSTEQSFNTVWVRHFKLRESIKRTYSIMYDCFPVRCIKN